MHPCPRCLVLALKILISCYQWCNNFKNEKCGTSNICCSLNSFFQLLIGPRNERPLSTFWYQPSGHFKNVDCSTLSLILPKFDLTFCLINDPEKVTPLYIDGSNQIWTKFIHSLLQNINILIQSGYHFKNVNSSNNRLNLVLFWVSGRTWTKTYF